MAEAVQPVPVLKNIPTGDKETKVYASPYATPLALGDKIPLVVSEEIVLEPSGQASVQTTHDGVIIAAPGETTYNQLVFEVAAPDSNAKVAQLIDHADPSKGGTDRMMQFNIRQGDGGYDVGYWVVDWVRHSGTKNGVHTKRVAVTPFAVKHIKSADAVTTP